MLSHENNGTKNVKNAIETRIIYPSIPTHTSRLSRTLEDVCGRKGYCKTLKQIWIFNMLNFESRWMELFPITNQESSNIS